MKKYYLVSKPVVILAAVSISSFTVFGLSQLIRVAFNG